MNRKAALALACVALTVVCRAEEGPPMEVSDSAFSFNLLKKIAGDHPATNLCISPYSAATVLEMVGNGAAGRTKAEMQQVLGTTGLSSANVNAAHKSIVSSLKSANNQVVLEMADAIWYRSGSRIRPEFVAISQGYYDATVEALDFGDPHAVSVINDWAADKTHGKITHIADGMIDPQSARLFLADAVYFKGRWSNPFKAEDTKERPFYLRAGGAKKVPMMMQTHNLKYLQQSNYQAARLPYVGENLAMYVFLPATDSSLESLLTELTGDTWEQVRQKFRNTDGTLVLPKFKLEYGTDLKAPLQSLGMKAAFAPKTADFSGIGPDLFISAAIQKTFVEVNEEGTEAAAVTGVAVATTSFQPRPEPFQMIVERPFLFIIEDRPTHTILFVGAVFDP